MLSCACSQAFFLPATAILCAVQFAKLLCEQILCHAPACTYIYSTLEQVATEKFALIKLKNRKSFSVFLNSLH
jgi:hypothetical protein